MILDWLRPGWLGDREQPKRKTTYEVPVTRGKNRLNDQMLDAVEKLAEEQKRRSRAGRVDIKNI